MKLFVQIPCLNEEKTLGLVLESIPKKISGIDQIEILVIDDGSSDQTIQIAKDHGVRHFVKHQRNMGLARSFHDGVNYALKHGADIVVNTDGDNQYPQAMIGELVKPIIDQRAEIVIGDRQTAEISHFSGFKKIMQRFGSWVVNQAAQTDLPDAASGFRAYSRYSLYRINIITEFSYCMETIIQAGNKRLKIVSIPISTNPKTRESRLFNSIWQHMFKSGSAIVRSYIMFHSKKVFGGLAIIFLILGGIPFIRYGLFAIQGEGSGHLQSLVFGSTMLVGSLLSISLLIIADMLQTNRTLLEDQLERIKDLQYKDQK
ncbi:glycosyltransferase family 2 protein [Candidatus Nomurabacteria bacterium]|nr:glycosyltransferase family 2 protein [Candidatus Nomurabacteria bacterium]